MTIHLHHPSFPLNNFIDNFIYMEDAHFTRSCKNQEPSHLIFKYDNNLQTIANHR